MNIAFFLVAKSDVIYLTPKNTMRQAIEKMQHHRHSAVPIIDNKGQYVGTITEGDLLRKLKTTPNLTFESTDKVLIEKVELQIHNAAVRIDAQMEDLLALASSQNFVPVIDDNDIFIGIIRRREIIEYFMKTYISHLHE